MSAGYLLQQKGEKKIFKEILDFIAEPRQKNKYYEENDKF